MFGIRVIKSPSLLTCDQPPTPRSRPTPGTTFRIRCRLDYWVSMLACLLTYWRHMTWRISVSARQRRRNTSFLAFWRISVNGSSYFITALACVCSIAVAFSFIHSYKGLSVVVRTCVWQRSALADYIPNVETFRVRVAGATWWFINVKSCAGAAVIKSDMVVVTITHQFSCYYNYNFFIIITNSTFFSL